MASLTATDADRRGPEPARSGRWIPWMFVLGFGIVLTANATMVWVALTTWTGLETRNHYKEGLAYNERIADARRQDRLGWEAVVRIDAADVAAGTIEVDLRDARDRPLRGAHVAAEVLRPTHEGYDFTLVLPEVAPGRYRQSAAFPLAGQWEVRLLARRDGREFRRIDRVFVGP
jgi:nitrogen fixation protein FixH